MNISKKQLTQLNKFKSGKLSILQTVLIDSTTITACNLGGGSKFEVPVFYQISHQTEVSGRGCIPVDQFVKIARKYEIQAINFTDKHKAEIVTGAGTFSIQGEDAQEFPTVPTVQNDSDISISLDHLEALKPYTSTDDLRPAMCGIFFDSENMKGVSTDGHRLKAVDIDSENFESFILPNAAIGLTGKSDYRHYPARQFDTGKFEAIATPGGGEIIFYSEVYEKYPNWRSVWPVNLDNSFEVDKKELQKAVEAALIVSNSTTKQLRLIPNDSGMYISSADMDLETEYKSDSIGEMVNKVEPYPIGFNGGYLSDILKKEKVDKIRFQFSGKNRVSIINNNLLLMPVMIDTYI